jgi:hypothetical protein
MYVSTSFYLVFDSSFEELLAKAGSNDRWSDLKLFIFSTRRYGDQAILLILRLNHAIQIGGADFYVNCFIFLR